MDRFWQNLRRSVGWPVQYFAAVEPQRRLAPHLHAAIRGTMARKLIKQVAAATCYQVWWPHHDEEIYSQADPPPELTALLHAHIAEFATGADGRLFPGERAGELPRNTYMRAWRAARKLAFTEAVAASPLAATAYALRHACVSTWLSGGVPPTQVAEWAGHSVEVLLKVYAKTLDGHEELARRRVMEALGHNRP